MLWLKHFSKIDLRTAYLQMEMDDESKTLLTLNAADADLCGTCLNDRLTTCIMAGVASEDLRKKLLAINPFPRLEDPLSQRWL